MYAWEREQGIPIQATDVQLNAPGAKKPQANRLALVGKKLMYILYSILLSYA